MAKRKDMCGKMTTKTEKLWSLIEGLHEFLTKSKRATFTRRDIRKLIIWKLSYSDAHTINSWLDVLLVKGFISFRYEDDKNKKPTNKTVYNLNFDLIERFLINERPKRS